MNSLDKIPVSLYVHLPWCVKKCPYCDFNSFVAGAKIPEEAYIAALERDLAASKELLSDRALTSIFFGGGTPSLFSANSIDRLLQYFAKHISFTKDIEITLEANPGTIDTKWIKDYISCGVNRVSVGAQSFSQKHLEVLGRIHNTDDIYKSVDTILDSGCDNFNIDVMFALPKQSIAEAMQDLDAVLEIATSHISWYQLTLEPNTLFYRKPPKLPDNDITYEIQQLGREKLENNGYKQYEISAYSIPGKECKHNLNYWQFGDYLGIGAGAHSKITTCEGIKRYIRERSPTKYMKQQIKDTNLPLITEDNLIFEFILNATRLLSGFSIELFQHRTGLPFSTLEPKLAKLKNLGLVDCSNSIVRPTSRGFELLNDLQGSFLPQSAG